MFRRALIASFVSLAASPAAAGALEIAPVTADCVVAGRYARVGACITAPDGLRRARVFYRGASTKAWSFVEMQADESCMMGVLPPFPRDAGAVEYYIEAADSSAAEARTEVLRLRIVSGAAACPSTALRTAAPPASEPHDAGSRAPLLVGVALAGAGTGALVAANAGGDDPVPSPSGLSLAVVPGGTALAAATLLTFTANATGSGVSYSWNFGDGGTGSGPAVGHTYAVEGNYGVTVTATNEGGSAAAVATVTVRSLSGQWDWVLSNGFHSELTLTQSGTAVTGPGDGFVLTGEVSTVRELSFVSDGNKCHESGKVSGDESLNVFTGVLDGCDGVMQTLTLSRR